MHTGKLYWPETLCHTKEYPPLQQNKKVQVAIIGGGVSGTICSSQFVRSGLTTIMIERSQVACGSTLANTGLLQYCNDITLCDLIDQIGQQDAQAFYIACKEAIEMLGSITKGLSTDVGFKNRTSLYYASTEQLLPKLKQEYEALRTCGLPVQYWSPDDIANHFPFRKPGAIVTHGDAEINPYQFVTALASAAVEEGLELYEQTDVIDHKTSASGFHLLRTTSGYEIEAEHVVYAIGYEPEELRGKLIKANLNRSYAIVTGIQKNLQKWHERFLIWETARPYLYLRTTPDGRAAIGGLDEDPEQPLQSESSREKRTEKLYKQFQALFPEMQAPIEYEWNGTFGESLDGLPFIGEDPSWKKVYYCLGYGGNGTVYSMIGATLLRDLILGNQHPLAHILKLDRPSLIDR